MSKSARQLLIDLQSLGFAVGRGAPTEDGLREIVQEALVEAALDHNRIIAYLFRENQALRDFVVGQMGTIASAILRDQGEPKPDDSEVPESTDTGAGPPSKMHIPMYGSIRPDLPNAAALEIVDTGDELDMLG